MEKTWVVGTGGLRPVSSLDELKILLCAQRGLEADAMQHFFEPEYQTVIHDPHALFGMSEAVERIYFAIKHGERIVIYGDYDADGVTSTATLVSVLRELGAGPIPYLPHRADDGYGLNQRVLEQLKDDFDLLITVDCGVANVEEIAWLKTHNKDVIVVDHHEMALSLPQARAVLHPRNPNGAYPWGYLCGVGVTWKLCQALLRDPRSPVASDPDHEKWLLDLVMLGTIADIVPLMNENRAIVQFGLEVLRRSKRPGIRALLKLTKTESATCTAEDMAFRLIPRLNAPGRLDHAQPALDLMLAPDEERAYVLAQRLEEYNLERQKVARKVLKEAQAQVIGDSPFVFAYNIAWPAGIVGLAAGKLAEAHQRPAIVVGGNGRHAVGSARSPQGMNVLNLLESGREHLLKLGGHAQAAGFSLDEETINSFHATLTRYRHEGGVQPASSKPSHYADAVVEASLLQWNMATALKTFEPFGEGNKRPMFVIQNMTLVDVRTVGKKGDHAKFSFDAGGKTVDGIGFGLGSISHDLPEKVHVLASPEINTFMGRSRLQLQIKDIADPKHVTIQEKVLVEDKAHS